MRRGRGRVLRLALAALLVLNAAASLGCGGGADPGRTKASEEDGAVKAEEEILATTRRRNLVQMYAESGGPRAMDGYVTRTGSGTGSGDDSGDDSGEESAGGVYATPGYVSSGISPKEYLVALYVIPLWLCLILICLRGTARWSIRRHNASASQRTEDGSNRNLGSRGRDSNSGLTTSTLQQLKQYSFRRVGSRAKADKYQTMECSICMEAFQDGECVRELPMCGHIFHSECIDEWLSLNGSCPICRRDIAEALEEQGEASRETQDHAASAAVAGGAPPGSMTALDIEQGVRSAPAESAGASTSSRGGGGEGDQSRAPAPRPSTSTSWFANPFHTMRESWGHQARQVSQSEARLQLRRSRARQAAVVAHSQLDASGTSA